MVTRARQAWPATGRRLHARLLARRAATGASRGHRRRSAGRPDAVAGSALSSSVRDCKNDAQWCPRRASRRSYGCRGSCSRPWWWSGVTRAALVGDVGVGVARLRRQVSSSAMGLFGIGVGGLVCPNTLGQKKLSDKKYLHPLATKRRSTY